MMGMKPSEENDEGCPESWEMADLEESMKRLMPASSSSQGDGFGGDKTFVDVQVDDFLREALQNTNDRLTILRLEQEVERFVKNPKLQQLEFPPMASSYMRLAAHRVAQHYYLLTSVLDSSAGEGCRIIVRKSGESGESRPPPVRLADIPVASEASEAGSDPNLKFVIKQRPRGDYLSSGDHGTGDGVGSSGSRNSSSKTVEERNEEYNKARARIFRHELEKGSENLLEMERQQQEAKRVCPRPVDPLEYGVVSTRRVSKAEKDKSRQKVAIFRDREKDRKDPDYDRNYDRYSQRFDPGFGLNQPAFGMQARYTPVVNYNTEFPQLGCPPVRQISPATQPVQPWGAPPPPYQQHQDMLRPAAQFSHPRGVAPPPNVATYMSQYPYARPSVTYPYSPPVSQPENSSAQARRQ